MLFSPLAEGFANLKRSSDPSWLVLSPRWTSSNPVIYLPGKSLPSIIMNPAEQYPDPSSLQCTLKGCVPIY